MKTDFNDIKAASWLGPHCHLEVEPCLQVLKTNRIDSVEKQIFALLREHQDLRIDL